MQPIAGVIPVLFRACGARKFMKVPSVTALFLAPGPRLSSLQTNRRFKRLAALLDSEQRNSPMCMCTREKGRTQIQKAQREARRSLMHSGFFRQPVVRSGGAGHRPAVPPRQTPFPVAESLAAPVSPCSTKDGFSIGDSSRNTNGVSFVASLHGNDQMIEALATDGSDHPLYVSSPPRRAWCG